MSGTQPSLAWPCTDLRDRGFCISVKSWSPEQLPPGLLPIATLWKGWAWPPTLTQGPSAPFFYQNKKTYTKDSEVQRTSPVTPEKSLLGCSSVRTREDGSSGRARLREEVEGADKTGQGCVGGGVHLISCSQLGPCGSYWASPATLPTPTKRRCPPVH